MINKTIHSTLLGLCFLFVGIQLQAQDIHRQFDDLPCLNKNYNTLVHVTVDSSGRNPIMRPSEIREMMEEVSAFFSPICVSFSNCEINVIEDNYSYSNIQDQPIPWQQRLVKMSQIFGKPKRINVFVVDSIERVQCGYGEFKGIQTEDMANVYIELNGCPDKKPSQNLAHQLGHVFGLADTYDLNAPIELADGSNCADAGDTICDTPADPFGKPIVNPSDPPDIVRAYERDCEFIYEGTDSNNQYFQPDMGNIMSAYPCKCGFTREQYLRMVNSYNRSEYKHF